MIVSDTIWQPNLSGAGRAKYKALASAIREAIIAGHLSAGEKLPPVRDLAYRIGVTPGTVARAYTTLTEEGRLTAGVGRGTFVSERQASSTRHGFSSVEDAAPNNHEFAHLMSPKIPDCGQAALMREGLRHMSDVSTVDQLLRYPTRETDLPARLAFQMSMRDAPVGPFDVGEVVAAHGGQNALIMILQTILSGPSPVILVDELSYGGFRSAAALCRANVVGVPWDQDGPDPAHFEELVKKHQAQAFCTSAEVCNPTGLTTTTARREEIARIAERYGVHVVDDDCYRLSKHSGPSYRSLLPHLGWYVTSPSKSITAALRIGFAIAPEGWGNALTRTGTYSSFGVSRIITDLYAYVMAQPSLEKIMSDIRVRISADVRAAVNALGSHEITWSEDVPFIWIKLPLGWRAGEFCQAAETAGVMIKSAEDFALRESRTVHAVRIAINGLVPHAHFVEAMKTLRELLDNPPERISV